eukprot:PhM_4_TR2424/c0_g1_i1/m.1631
MDRLNATLPTNLGNGNTNNRSTQGPLHRHNTGSGPRALTSPPRARSTNPEKKRTGARHLSPLRNPQALRRENDVNRAALAGFLVSHRTPDGMKRFLPHQNASPELSETIEQFKRAAATDDAVVIDVGHCCLTPSDYVALRALLSSHPTLTEITFGARNTIDPIAAKMILSSAETNRKLVHMNFNGAKISDMWKSKIEDQLLRNRSKLQQTQIKQMRKKMHLIHQAQLKEIELEIAEMFAEEDYYRGAIFAVEYEDRAAVLIEHAKGMRRIQGAQRRLQKNDAYLKRVQSCFDQEDDFRAQLLELEVEEYRVITQLQFEIIRRIILAEQETVRNVLKKEKTSDWVLTRRAEKARLKAEHEARVFLCEEEEVHRRMILRAEATIAPALEHQIRDSYASSKERETVRVERERHLEVQRVRAEEAQKERKEREEAHRQRVIAQMLSDHARARERADFDATIFRNKVLQDEEIMMELLLGAHRIARCYLDVRDRLHFTLAARGQRMLEAPKIVLNSPIHETRFFHTDPTSLPLAPSMSFVYAMTASWRAAVCDNDVRLRHEYKETKQMQKRTRQELNRYRQEKVPAGLDLRTEVGKAKAEVREATVRAAEPSVDGHVPSSFLSPAQMETEKNIIWGGFIRVKILQRDEFDEQLSTHDHLFIEPICETLQAVRERHHHATEVATEVVADGGAADEAKPDGVEERESRDDEVTSPNPVEVVRPSSAATTGGQHTPHAEVLLASLTPIAMALSTEENEDDEANAAHGWSVVPPMAPPPPDAASFDEIQLSESMLHTIGCASLGGLTSMRGGMEGRRGSFASHTSSLNRKKSFQDRDKAVQDADPMNAQNQIIEEEETDYAAMVSGGSAEDFDLFEEVGAEVFKTTEITVNFPRNGSVTAEQITAVLQSFSYRTSIPSLKSSGPFERRIELSVSLEVAHQTRPTTNLSTGEIARPAETRLVEQKFFVSVVVSHPYLWIPAPMRHIEYREEEVKPENFRVLSQLVTYDPPFVLKSDEESADDGIFVEAGGGGRTSLTGGLVVIDMGCNCSVEDQIIFMGTQGSMWLANKIVYARLKSQDLEIGYLVEGNLLRPSAAEALFSGAMPTPEFRSKIVIQLSEKIQIPASLVRRILSRFRYVNISHNPQEGERMLRIGVQDNAGHKCLTRVVVDVFPSDDPAELIIEKRCVVHRIPGCAPAATEETLVNKFHAEDLYTRVMRTVRVEDEDTDRFLGGYVEVELDEEGRRNGDAIVLLCEPYSSNSAILKTSKPIKAAVLYDAATRRLFYEGRHVATMESGLVVQSSRYPTALTSIAPTPNDLFRIRLHFETTGESSVTSTQAIVRSVAFTSTLRDVARNMCAGKRTLHLTVQLGNTVPRPALSGKQRPYRHDPEAWDDAMEGDVCVDVVPGMFTIPSIHTEPYDYIIGTGAQPLAPLSAVDESVGRYMLLRNTVVLVDVVTDGSDSDRINFVKGANFTLKPQREEEEQPPAAAAPSAAAGKKAPAPKASGRGAKAVPELDTKAAPAAQPTPSVSPEVIKLRSLIRQSILTAAGGTIHPSFGLVEAARECYECLEPHDLIRRLEIGTKTFDILFGGSEGVRGVLFKGRRSIMMCFPTDYLRRCHLQAVLRGLTFTSTLTAKDVVGSLDHPISPLKSPRSLEAISVKSFGDDEEASAAQNTAGDRYVRIRALDSSVLDGCGATQVITCTRIRVPDTREFIVERRETETGLNKNVLYSESSSLTIACGGVVPLFAPVGDVALQPLPQEAFTEPCASLCNYESMLEVEPKEAQAAAGMTTVKSSSNMKKLLRNHSGGVTIELEMMPNSVGLASTALSDVVSLMSMEQQKGMWSFAQKSREGSRDAEKVAAEWPLPSESPFFIEAVEPVMLTARGRRKSGASPRSTTSEVTESLTTDSPVPRERVAFIDDPASSLSLNPLPTPRDKHLALVLRTALPATKRDEPPSYGTFEIGRCDISDRKIALHFNPFANSTLGTMAGSSPAVKSLLSGCSTKVILYALSCFGFCGPPNRSGGREHFSFALRLTRWAVVNNAPRRGASPVTKSRQTPPLQPRNSELHMATQAQAAFDGIAALCTKVLLVECRAPTVRLPTRTPDNIQPQHLACGRYFYDVAFYDVSCQVYRPSSRRKSISPPTSLPTAPSKGKPKASASTAMPASPRASSPRPQTPSSQTSNVGVTLLDKLCYYLPETELPIRSGFIRFTALPTSHDAMSIVSLLKDSFCFSRYFTLVKEGKDTQLFYDSSVEAVTSFKASPRDNHTNASEASTPLQGAKHKKVKEVVVSPLKFVGKVKTALPANAPFPISAFLSVEFSPQTGVTPSEILRLLRSIVFKTSSSSPEALTTNRRVQFEFSDEIASSDVTTMYIDVQTFANGESDYII